MMSYEDFLIDAKDTLGLKLIADTSSLKVGDDVYIAFNSGWKWLPAKVESVKEDGSISYSYGDNGFCESSYDRPISIMPEVA